MKGKRWASGLLALALALGLSTPALAAEETPQTLTRSEVCQRLVEAAEDYNTDVTTADVMKGDGSGLQEDRTATRAEVLVMLSRAFGDLPEPVGDSARWAYPASNYTDLPAWAAQELENVLTSGIVAGTSATTLSPEDPITADELDALIRRVYTIEGSNLKDDYYATINKDWLATSTLPAGYPYIGGIYSLDYEVTEQVSEIIQEIVKSSPREGSPEAKIKALYETILDWDARNEAGVTPLKPYLEQIDAASSLEELMEVHNKLVEELCLSTLAYFNLTVDDKDSTQYILHFGITEPSLTKDYYTEEYAEIQSAFRTYVTDLLTLAGQDADSAAQDAALLYDMEQELSAVKMDQQDYLDVDKTYNLFTLDELQAMLPNVDLTALLESSGLAADSKIVVYDPKYLEAGAAYFDEDHLEVLKVTMKAGLLGGLGSALSRDFFDVNNQYQLAVTGMDNTMPDDQLAARLVQQYLSDYLGEAYVERYFPAEAKRDVTAMIESILDVYKERILALDWMSDTTKQQAVEKLEAITIKVGYPDVWDSYLDDAQIQSSGQGGTYLDNVISLLQASRAQDISHQGKPVDKNTWQMPAYMVNAYYDPLSNSINFPAGILQAPLYDVDAPSAQNLGGIGYVIAHEISHAFDNSGSKYDKNGNAADWWTAEDYAAFQKLCDKVVALYDGVEVIPGVTCNGALTITENIADLGAMACVLQLEGQAEDPDYKTVFEGLASTWCFTTNRDTYAYLAQVDYHAPSKLRVNRVLQNFAEFYETYDIQPEDGMYLDPADRVQIW